MAPSVGCDATNEDFEIHWRCKGILWDVSTAATTANTVIGLEARSRRVVQS